MENIYRTVATFGKIKATDLKEVRKMSNSGGLNFTILFFKGLTYRRKTYFIAVLLLFLITLIMFFAIRHNYFAKSCDGWH